MWIALLRGINVGGKNKLPMKELVELVESLGYEEVRTYIQSGNVIFSGTAAAVKKAPERIAAGIRKRWGYDVPVVLRSARELAGVVKRNPFRKSTDNLNVMFLADKPSAVGIAALDPDRSPPDRFKVVGREVFLDAPNGARSKLTNRYFDTKLSTISTARNWRTVHKLIALCERE